MEQRRRPRRAEGRGRPGGRPGSWPRRPGGRAAVRLRPLLPVGAGSGQTGVRPRPRHRQADRREPRRTCRRRGRRGWRRPFPARARPALGPRALGGWSGRPTLDFFLEGAKAALERVVEHLLKLPTEEPRHESAIRLRRAHECGRVTWLEPPEVDGLDAERPSRPGDQPRRLDSFDPGCDRPRPGLPTELRALGDGAVDRHRLDLGVPARPLLEVGQHIPDDVGARRDLDLSRARNRCPLVDAGESWSRLRHTAPIAASGNSPTGSPPGDPDPVRRRRIPVTIAVTIATATPASAATCIPCVKASRAASRSDSPSGPDSASAASVAPLSVSSALFTAGRGTPSEADSAIWFR